MTRTRWNVLILLALVFGSVWIWLNRMPAGDPASPTSRPAAPAVGYPAPDFALQTSSGEEFKLSAQRGTPVVVNFWATWCSPCRAELPELRSASERYAGRITVVGVTGESAPTVAKSASELGLTFPIPLDDRGKVGQVYGVRSLPTTFFIDQDGVIRQIHNGPLTEATLAQLLQTIYP